MRRVLLLIRQSFIKHNIARGEAGGHTESVNKHKQALDLIIRFLISSTEQ